MAAFVELKGVKKIYRMGEVVIKAVDNMNFSIEKGEFVVIVGPSGAGKTTVLNILGGMDDCDEGEIWIDGTLYKEANAKSVCIPFHEFEEQNTHTLRIVLK